MGGMESYPVHSLTHTHIYTHTRARAHKLRDTQNTLFTLYISRWEDHRGAVIPNEGHIKADDGLLTLTNARQADSGNYTCVVSNTAGVRRKNIWIVVSGKTCSCLLSVCVCVCVCVCVLSPVRQLQCFILNNPDFVSFMHSKVSAFTINYICFVIIRSLLLTPVIVAIYFL